MTTPTTLYRLYDHAGQLLYIGVAGNPGRRFEQHRHGPDGKPWWGDVTTIRLEHLDDRQAAFDAERSAIIAEHPRHNVIHNRGKRETIEGVHSVDTPGWTFRNRESHIELAGVHLQLYAELDCSSCVQDLDWADGYEQLDYYIEYLTKHHPDWLLADAIPIVWAVAEAANGLVYEAAPYTNGPGSDETFLDIYTWPRNTAGDRLDWFTLPVVMDRFPAFTRALGWQPSPLQPTCPLRSILASQAGRKPGDKL